MSENPSRPPLLGNGVYDVLKPIVQLGLPAVGTLYFTIAQIWGLPNAEQVVGTIAAVTTFLGVVLAISSRTYNTSDAKYDGVFELQEQETGAKLYSLNLNDHPENLEKKKEVLFKVDNP